MKNGYDRYLEFQFRQTGKFFTLLFEAISNADEINVELLRKGFPEEVDAVHAWQRQGQDALIGKCTPGHPLIERLQLEQ